MSLEIASASREAPEPPLFVANAGLVLLSPFFPHLFERLGLLTGSDQNAPRVDDADSISRAVHLLEYLVTGRLDTPAPQLTLNKLLAGVSLSAEIAPRIDPPTTDLEICDGLLAAAIANWPSIRSTTPAGLRETFLQREGRLRSLDDQWELHVQRKTVDVLVDQIPWSLATVFHRWMPGPVRVVW
jgi:hypothetical protein